VSGPIDAPAVGRYELDRGVVRRAAGRLLVGGTPARLVRLSATGSRALDQLLAGTATARAAALRDRLRGSGMLHPLAAAPAAAEVTFVIPVCDGGEALTRLVGGLVAGGAVIVVDDGSGDGSPQRARAAGARVISNPGPPGPAAARNAGLAAAKTGLVAFLDADCLSPGDWAASLAPILEEDPELAIVAPRVRGLPGAGAIARYETGYSPLDQGAEPSLVGPGRRVGFVPSAALLARREALLAVGGFDHRLRVGEDVDLVWRLIEAGWRVRYAPEAEVFHLPRTSLVGLARQRVAYGGSAAVLDARHPGAAAPLRAGWRTLAVWGAAAAWGWRGGVATATASVLAIAAGGEDRDTRLALGGLAVRGQLGASRRLCGAAVRDWLPLTLLACAVSPRARRGAALALGVDFFASRRPGGAPIGLASRLALRLLDVSSYSAGLWAGMVRRRSLGAALPRLGGVADRPK
jgi:mycofactocin system glycosyltransferase